MAAPALLALEDGSVFRGISIGCEGEAFGEVVFNTAMSGYQEVLTDPSYARQIVTFTYPHIGSTGCNEEDLESDRVWATGLVIRDLPLLASSFRARMNLPAFLERERVVAIAEIDTRRLTRLIRTKGALAGVVVAGAEAERLEDGAAAERARTFPGLQGLDLVQEVTDEYHAFKEGVWCPGTGYPVLEPDAGAFRVVVYNFGVKRNILRLLASHQCAVTVVPARTPAEQVLAMAPDGVLLSNGPGDPEPCGYAVAAIRTLLAARVPLFGICLGYQLLGLAAGARIMKMFHGHHGANHPVKELATKRVMITSQNHGFAVDDLTLGPDLEATHISLFDGSLQGIRHRRAPAAGFQGHPEASPGPHDAGGIMKQFVELMAAARGR